MNTQVLDAQLEQQQHIMAELAARNAQRETPPTAFVDTYGCQQNEADSERIRGMLQEMGFARGEDAQSADIVVLNTCAIREHAELRVLGHVGALKPSKEQNPGKIIVLCGCMMQEEGTAEKIKKSYRHVDLVFGTHVIWQFPELLHRIMTRRGRIFAVEQSEGVITEGLPQVRESAHEAWVSIMYGCNNFCTYCIVPSVRGRERSRRPEVILDEVRTLATQGYREITLLGQNVNSYGKDLNADVDFAGLLEQINAIDGDFLVRFMTSHPRDASPRLFSVMAHCEKIAPHLHLPVQAGSNRVLTAMNRHYTREHYLDLIADVKAKIPHLVLTSDIIVGFPGETTAEFEETLSLIEQVRYDALFTFIYSPRVGTPAAELDDPMSRADKGKNFQRLLDAQTAIGAERQARWVGETLRCFVQKEGDDPRYSLHARTPGGRLVHFNGDATLIGSFQRIKITGASNWVLFGELEV